MLKNKSISENGENRENGGNHTDINRAATVRVIVEY